MNGPPLTPISDDPFSYIEGPSFHKKRTSLPPGLVVTDEEVGRGSNNRVWVAELHGKTCAFRVPRRKSDTQQRGSATWELAHTLRASQLGASPAVYDAWLAKHASKDYPSGLYVVTDLFEYDLDRLFTSRSKRELALSEADAIATSVVSCLSTLAKDLLFVYDLKPSNVVVRTKGPGEAPVAKLIDFGRDFCEWKREGRIDESTPVVDMVFRLAKGNRELVSHLLFAAMLVQLSATVTSSLYEDRRAHRMDREERALINGVARSCRSFLDSMTGQNRAALRTILRHDAVKGVLAHYHGRSNAGTGRTLAFAVGKE